MEQNYNRNNDQFVIPITTKKNLYSSRNSLNKKMPISDLNYNLNFNTNKYIKQPLNR